MERATALAGDLPVVFQELGCPASPLLGSSEAMQTRSFEQAFQALRPDPRMRAAFVFELSDWSPETIDLDYGDAMVMEPGLEAYWARFRAWLGTGGLLRSDLTTRPAWEVYLDNLGG